MNAIPVTNVSIEQAKLEVKDLQTRKTSEATFILKSTHNLWIIPKGQISLNITGIVK
jgi:hypothetical protein